MVGAIVFVIDGNIFVAGLLLMISGLFYLTLNEQIFETTSEIEKKFPQLRFLSRLVGGNTSRGIKFGGIVLLVVGVLWVFF